MTLSVSRHVRRSLLPCVFSAAALALVVPAAAAQVDVGSTDKLPAGRLNGEAAVNALGAGLDGVAQANGMTAEQLTEIFRTDDTLYVDGNDNLFYIDEATAPRVSEVPSYNGEIPVEEAFNLSSLPGATKTIYLDFDGHHSVNNSWNHDIEFPAYNTSGSPDTFSTSELLEIIAHWKYVVEDFAPFEVNVTTLEPPLSALTKNGSGDQTYGIRCVMTQATDGFGGFGGIAFLNSFNDSIDNPCFALNKGMNNGSMTASHEVGHTLGLSHDGLGGQSYHPGTGSGETSWGPIMGAPFGDFLVQWSPGDYPNSTTTQNDVNIITGSSNGINWLDDDHGDDHTSASPLSAAIGCPDPLPASATGVIGRRTDVDAFEFTTAAGIVTIDAVPLYSPGGNLDLQVDVVDGSGALLGSANQEDESDASLSIELPAGTYYALVDGVGKPGVYSDYGSLGQYTIYVTTPGTEPLVNLGGSVPAGNGITPAFTITGTACPGELMSWNLINAPWSAPAYLMMGFFELSLPFKGGVLVPDINPPGVIIPTATNFVGLIFLNLEWPAGLPAGLSMYLQYWIQDPSAVAGFAASNGFRIYAP